MNMNISVKPEITLDHEPLRIPDEPKKEEERNIPFRSRSEDCLEPESLKREFSVREAEDRFPTQAECLQTRLPTPQQHPCGGEGAVRSFRSSEAFARKGTTS